MLEKIFKLKEQNTTIRTEVVAGLTTFLTMSYIIFVNPNILHDATGMDHGAVFVATCLAAVIGCLLMAFLANWPIGMAPGMGLNGLFAFTVVKTMGYTWEQALAAVFVSGVVFLVLTALGLRKWLINGIPIALRQGITVGIGLFLAITAFKSVGIVVAKPELIMGTGNLLRPEVLFVGLGLVLIVALDNFKVKGSILISILSLTILSILLGYSKFSGIVSTPPSLAPTFMKLDLSSILEIGIFQVILVFVLVEMFDATGTLIGISQRAGLLPENKPNNLNKALFADSTAILAGSVLGTSSTTAYIESASGVEAGGRTGLTALTIAICFLIALWFSPLAAAIPTFAVAPALIYIAALMAKELTVINSKELTDYIPTILTAISIPFLYSIADGLAVGFISYTFLKLATAKFQDIHPANVIITILFIGHYFI